MQEQLLNLLTPYIKTAVELKPEPDNAAITASTDSKFGGLPYSESGCGWPGCPTCASALTFVAQLNKKVNNSLYVFYYCFDCFPWGLGGEETGQWLVQEFPEPSMDKYQKIDVQKTGAEITPCRVIEVEVKVLPDCDSIDSEIPEVNDLCSQINHESPWEAYDLAVTALGCIDDCATRIGGYPKLIQGEIEATCGVCSKKMDFLAQIDSEDDANLMWGDVGSVYLFQCSEHPSEFHLELQCC